MVEQCTSPLPSGRQTPVTETAGDCLTLHHNTNTQWLVSPYTTTHTNTCHRNTQWLVSPYITTHKHLSQKHPVTGLTSQHTLNKNCHRNTQWLVSPYITTHTNTCHRNTQWLVSPYITTHTNTCTETPSDWSHLTSQHTQTPSDWSHLTSQHTHTVTPPCLKVRLTSFLRYPL